MVMASIYVECGEYDKAIDELEVLLSEQTPFTVNDFKLNPDLEPLRKLPRYQEMIKKYSGIVGLP
jgi:hypothetical protein